MLYGLAIACLVFGLKWLKWNFLIVDNAVDIYVGMIALVFTLLGIWVATQIIKPQKETVLLDRPVIAHHTMDLVIDQNEVENLNLSTREFQVLKLIVKGYSNSDIAEELFLSISTIKTHVSNLYSKMNVKNRFQAMAKATRLKIAE